MTSNWFASEVGNGNGILQGLLKYNCQLPSIFAMPAANEHKLELIFGNIWSPSFLSVLKTIFLQSFTAWICGQDTLQSSPGIAEGRSRRVFSFKASNPTESERFGVPGIWATIDAAILIGFISSRLKGNLIVTVRAEVPLYIPFSPFLFGR